MIKHILTSILFLLITLPILGYSSSKNDMPLPINEKMLQLLMKEINTTRKTFTLSPILSQEEKENKIIGSYKNIIEINLGYNFNKTIRSFILFNESYGLYWVQILASIVQPILEKPKQYFKNGYISKRTYEIINIQKEAKLPLKKRYEEFIGYVKNCEDHNNGSCTQEKLTEILYKKSKIADEDYIAYKKNKSLSSVSIRIENKYHYDMSKMGMHGWIVKENGEVLNTNGLLDSSHIGKFKLNNKKINLSKRYAEIIEEEKKLLYP